MSDLVLRATVRQRLAETDEPDPGVIAEQVISALQPYMLRAALGLTMRAYVREVMRDLRRGAVEVDPPSPPAVGRSRARAVAEAWKAHLRTRVFVGDTGWRLLGDCSPEDLDFLAADRRQKAAELEAVAERYALIRKAMDEHDVKVVRDLPDAVLGEMLGDPA